MRKVFIAIFTLLLIVTAAFFLFRNSLLQWAFDKEKEKFKNKYHVNLSAGALQFTGLEEITLKNVTAVPADADTLLNITHAKISLSLFNFIKGSAAFDAIELDSMYLNIFNTPSRSNITFLKARPSATNTTGRSEGETSYRQMFEKLVERVFAILDTKFNVRGLTLQYRDSLRNERLLIPYFNYNKKTFAGNIIALKDAGNDTLALRGQVVKHHRIYNFSFENKSSRSYYLPFLNVDRHIRSRVNSARGSIELKETSSYYWIMADVSADSFRINHWRLAEEDVLFPFLNFNGIIKIEDNAVTLDSASVLKINHAAFKMYSHFVKKPEQIVALKIKMDNAPSDSFFTALPGGMFSTLKGIKTSGALTYELNFRFNKSKPDSLVFDSSLRKKNFRIIQYGRENYSRINSTFLFDAMDRDRLVRKIVVGPENASFTPIDHISIYLVYAVLTSEDGSFMYHRGFNEDAFRQSIITNYKAGRFVRGGSTITMQLVKNCFLSRDKTISRKAEEALIVWLIENNGLVSKERMLEVYLNVIEWGPDVYGIGEASQFYFAKQPKDLTLAESIYLTSIIPHPKYFKYSFDTTGTLKPYLGSYYHLITSKMLGRNWISPADTIGLQPAVRLTGPAKLLVLPTDTFTMPADSLFEDDIEIL